MYCIIFQGNIPPQELTTIPNELAYAISNFVSRSWAGGVL